MDVLWKDNNIFYNVLCFLITENEKLFDRSDAKLYWKSVYHIFTMLHHIYIGVFATGLDLSNPHVQINNLYRFRAGYLTGWNFLFQTVFLSLSVGHDALEWLDRHETTLGKKLRYYRDVLFCGVVLPLTIFISTMFWTVFWIDRELVFPKIYDDIVPWWFNHCVHTNIVVVILVETIIQARTHPTNRKLELILNGVVGVLYAIVYYSIYFFTKRWLYGVFGIMTWWQICLYQILIWTSTYVFYFIQFPINRIFHKAKGSPEIKEQQNYVVETEKSVEKANGESDSKQVFSTSWSLKYRTIRSQFENSSL